jgi:tetratricopeptide (TPR) repeat protein
MTDTKVTHDYDQETLAASGDTLASAPRGPSSRPQRDAGLQPGDRVGRYVIEAALGQGGMGTVLAARDPDLDRRVAIKVLHPQTRPGADSTGGPQRLLREAQAMAKLAHPSVIAVHDVGVVGDRLFVAMEMIDGVDLRRWLAAQPRTWREVVAAFLQAGEGLAAAHAAGIIHRDFKPENVMVARGGRICVGDFGLAAADGAPQSAGDLQGSWLTTAGTLTVPGAVLGTPAYMAPEQMVRGEITVAADIFSFCVALYEALYGHRPFRGDTIGALYLAIQRGQVLPPGAAAAKIPRRLLRLLRSGLQHDPKARPTSLASELLPQLRALLERRRRRTIAVAAALVAAALAPVLVLYDPQPEVDCAAAAPQLAEITAPERLAAIERAFAGTGSIHHAETWRRVAAAIDEFSKNWRAARVDACEATHRRREQSPELEALRGDCFSRHLRDLDRLLTIYSDPDPKVVDNAVALIKSLPSARDCDPAEVLSAVAAEPPLTPELAELDAKISEARLINRVRRTDQAIELLDQTLAQLDEHDAPRVRARALVTRANAAYLDHRKDTQQWLTLALEATLRSGDDRRFAESVADQLGHVGRDPEARELWRALGEAALARHGGDEPSRAKLLTNYGNALREDNNPAAAAVAHREALELRRREAGAEFLVADALFNLSADYATLERDDEATVLLTEAVKIWRRELGPEHPRMIGALRNLAIFNMYAADYERAQEIAQEAYELARRTHGEGKPQLVPALLLVANLHARLGDAEQALNTYRRALEIGRLSPEHRPDRDIELYIGIATIESDRRDYRAADAAIQRALEAGGDQLPPNDLFWLAKHLMDAGIALGRGDLDAAEEAQSRALDAFRGSDHIHSIVYGDIALTSAEIDHHRGRYARALTTLQALVYERPLALKHPSARAHFHTTLARIFAPEALDRPVQARAHAEAALADLAALGSVFEPRRAELRRWLAEH